MKLNNKQFFPALTGFRAIAAWMIFVYHFFPFKNVNHSYPKWISDVVWEFHIGVDMFFVLSGFLITYRYFDENPIHFKKYMVNRFARIYPMYFILTIAVFLVGYLQSNTWTTQNTIQAILSFTMTKALFSEYNFAGIPQGWTLTLEEMFYFTAPFYFILIRKRLFWLFVLPVIVWLFGIYASELTNGINFGGFLQTGISAFIVEFFIGIGLALVIKKGLFNFKHKLLKITYIGMGGVIIYLLGMQNFREMFSFNEELGRFISMVLLSGLGIAPLLWGLIHEDTFVRRILSLPVLVLLGKASYIFYLIHKGFIPIFIDEHIWANKIFLFVVLNLLSIILFRYIEEPANQWIRKRYGKI